MSIGVRRSRVIYACVAVVVVAMGLVSRWYASALPVIIAKYSGDTLWAVMAFVAVGWIATAWPTYRVAATALVMSYAVEVSQLYHAAWIDAIRNTRLGALALGFGFLWSDIACYTVGVALCVAVEGAVYGRSTR